MQQPPTERNRILVVDDNADLAQATAQLLSLHGYEVRTAYDGPSALEAVLNFVPHVCVLDIGLPVMDGYEVARRLRERVLDLRLIAISGYGRDGEGRRAQEAGFDAHLVKPVDWNGLVSAMHA
jgi:CheY-like chemotaxis protein